MQELIYHLELAKGSYKDSPAALAKHSMLREKNIVKFIKDSSIMRPGYYVGVDTRNSLVVLGIRGTHTVHDIVTDLVSLSDDQKVSLEGFSTHFGTAEAARWFLHNELGTIRRCLEKYKVGMVGIDLCACITFSVSLCGKNFHLTFLKVGNDKKFTTLQIVRVATLPLVPTCPIRKHSNSVCEDFTGFIIFAPSGTK